MVKKKTYVEKKRQKNKDLRDLVTGLLNIIGPQIVKSGDEKALDIFRDLAGHLNNLSVQQVKYAATAVERMRRSEGRSDLPKEIIFELLRKDWYKKQ